jgi:O-methyltransferase
VLILDDYGHWQGARKAVDAYFAAHATPCRLEALGSSARIMLKSA